MWEDCRTNFLQNSSRCAGTHQGHALFRVDVSVQEEVSQYWFPARVYILATTCVGVNCVPTNRKPSQEGLLEPQHTVLCVLGPGTDTFQTPGDA